MTSKNDITGDSLISKSSNEKYREGWERIFGKKKREEVLDELVQESQKLGLYEKEGICNTSLV